jgi:hypothetical protein
VADSGRTRETNMRREHPHEYSLRKAGATTLAKIEGQRLANLGQ